MKSARLDSEKAYRELVQRVNALALVLGEADYAPFIDYASTEIVHYKREVLKQKAVAAQTSPGCAVITPTEPEENHEW